MKLDRIFITATLLVLLLHIGAGMLLVHDEKSRILFYQSEQSLPMDIMQLIPEEDLAAQMPEMDLSLPQEDSSESSEAPESPFSEPEKSLEDQATEEEQSEEEKAEDSESAAIKEETAPKMAQTREDAQESDEPETPEYQKGMSKGSDLMKEGLRPPREDGEYRRIVGTDTDPYKQLVENAITMLEDTPFLDKEWQDSPIDDDAPTYYSPEFFEYLRKFNPQEPINKEEASESEEPPIPTEAELSDEDQFGAGKPVTLIVNMIASPEIEALNEEIAKKKEAEKERSISRNIFNAAGSQIRRLEYNLALASSECYEKHIQGQSARHTLTVMILEKPLRVGIRRSSGSTALDSCVTKMTQQLIKIPAEMERIRKFAPRLGEAYILNATF